MRDCPTIQGSSLPLIVHRIAAEDCMSRQSCHYHKCHRCIYRGKAASWQPEGALAADNPETRVAERAVPTKIVEIPRPTKAPAPAKAPARTGAKEAPTSRKATKSKAAEAGN